MRAPPCVISRTRWVAIRASGHDVDAAAAWPSCRVAAATLVRGRGHRTARRRGHAAPAAVPWPWPSRCVAMATAAVLRVATWWPSGGHLAVTVGADGHGHRRRIAAGGSNGQRLEIILAGQRATTGFGEPFGRPGRRHDPSDHRVATRRPRERWPRPVRVGGHGHRGCHHEPWPRPAERGHADAERGHGQTGWPSPVTAKRAWQPAKRRVSAATLPAWGTWLG